MGLEWSIWFNFIFSILTQRVETIKDFLLELAMQPNMYLGEELAFFSELYHCQTQKFDFQSHFSLLNINVNF